MNSIELSPCPFCAYPTPTSVCVGHERVERIAIFCPECGAIGPAASADDAPDAAERLWNRRTGVNRAPRIERIAARG